MSVTDCRAPVLASSVRPACKHVPAWPFQPCLQSYAKPVLQALYRPSLLRCLALASPAKLANLQAFGRPV